MTDVALLQLFLTSLLRLSLLSMNIMLMTHSRRMVLRGLLMRSFRLLLSLETTMLVRVFSYPGVRGPHKALLGSVRVTTRATLLEEKIKILFLTLDSML